MSGAIPRERVDTSKLLSVVEACVVVGMPGHVSESGLPPTRRRPSILIRVLAQGLDAPSGGKGGAPGAKIN